MNWDFEFFFMFQILCEDYPQDFENNFEALFRKFVVIQILCEENPQDFGSSDLELNPV